MGGIGRVVVAGVRRGLGGGLEEKKLQFNSPKVPQGGIGPIRSTLNLTRTACIDYRSATWPDPAHVCLPRFRQLTF